MGGEGAVISRPEYSARRTRSVQSGQAVSTVPAGSTVIDTTRSYCVARFYNTGSHKKYSLADTGTVKWFQKYSSLSSNTIFCADVVLQCT